jgi:exfoliative toxin A/B
MSAKDIIKKIPVPICGLSLGLASLDRFLSGTYADIYTINIFMALSFVIAGLFTMRILIDRKGIREDINAPAVFGTLPTYTMTLMLLSEYVKVNIGGIAGDITFAIWISAIAASFVIMFFFVRRFILKFSIDKAVPSWIIIFVGYVVASVTSPAFGMEQLGQLIFWFGFTGCLVMLPLLLYRVLVYRKLPESLVPNVAIFAAPANLCVVGCLTAYGATSADPLPDAAGIALLIMAAVGLIMYTAVICYLPIMLNRKFYPSYSGLTFPLVISAVSFHKLAEYFGPMSGDALNIILTVIACIAIVIVTYVLIRYVMFLYGTAKSTGAQ